MQYIETSKIGKIHPKPNLTYPLIRLHQRYAHVIGKTAHIHKSLKEGRKAIVFSFWCGRKQRRSYTTSYKKNVESYFSARFAVLEEEIRQLRTLIEKEAHFSAK